MKLSELKYKQKAVIISLDYSASISQRLIEIGFSTGTEVEVILKGMNKNISAYRVKDTTIALRNNTADNINVLLKSGGIDEQ